MNIAEITKQAKKVMLKNGGHHPQLMIEDNRNFYISVLDYLPETTLEKKMLLFELGRDLAEQHDIEAKDVKQIVWICEAWFAKVPKDEYNDDTPAPSRHPNRQEGLIVLSLNIKEREVSQELHMVEIIRHGGSVDLLPYAEQEEVQSSLLTSCLAGVISASLSEDELTKVMLEAMKKAAAEDE